MTLIRAQFSINLAESIQRLTSGSGQNSSSVASLTYQVPPQHIQQASVYHREILQMLEQLNNTPFGQLDVNRFNVLLEKLKELTPNGNITIILNNPNLFAGRDLQGIDFSGYTIRSSDGRPVSFEQANLSGAKFKHCNLEGVIFVGCNLTNANFHSVNLQRCKFCSIIGEGISFHNCNLQGANFISSNLTSSNFYGSNLSNANLRHINARRASFGRTNLSNANVIAANFTDAYFGGTNLTTETLAHSILTGAEYYFVPSHPMHTIFPNGFDPQTHGMVRN